MWASESHSQHEELTGTEGGSTSNAGASVEDGADTLEHQNSARPQASDIIECTLDSYRMRRFDMEGIPGQLPYEVEVFNRSA